MDRDSEGNDWDLSYSELENEETNNVDSMASGAGAIASAPSSPPPPPPPASSIARNMNTNASNVADNNAHDSLRKSSSKSHKKKKLNNQALLRAKASLKCPPSYLAQRNISAPTNSSRAHTINTNNRLNERIIPDRNFAQRPVSAPTSNANRVAVSRDDNASIFNANLPNHRDFGLRSSQSSNSIRSSSKANNAETLSKGEWKIVQISETMIDVEISSPPCARSLHASAIWKDEMFIFGGYDGASRRNDFYSFNFKNKQWKLLNEESHGINGLPPSPRDRHCAVVHNNSFYVFGGFDGSARVNDFYKYDILRKEWTRILPNIANMTLPTSRHSHSAVVHNDSLWLFGGYDGSYRCDLFEYNFLTNIWTVVDAVGRIPRPRYRATCVAIDDFLILHGGHDGTRHLSDSHAFDLRNKRWTSLARVGNMPSSRDSHVTFVYNNSMFLFGGSAGGTAQNDMHELFIERSEDDLIPVWRKVICSGSIRSRFCHVGVLYGDSFYIFGGYDGDSRLNDFARFEFNFDDLTYDVTPSTLVQDLRSFINNEALSDIKFIVEGQTIYAHKMMLVRSSYFRAMFSGSMMESQQSVIHIEEIPSYIFFMVLEYLYTDHLEIDINAAMDLFAAADLFDIPRLQAMCEKSILESIEVENAASIFLEADLHSAITLRTKAFNYILKHFELVSKSASFEEMARSNVELVVEILRER